MLAAAFSDMVFPHVSEAKPDRPDDRTRRARQVEDRRGAMARYDIPLIGQVIGVELQPHRADLRPGERVERHIGW